LSLDCGARGNTAVGIDRHQGVRLGNFAEASRSLHDEKTAWPQAELVRTPLADSRLLGGQFRQATVSSWPVAHSTRPATSDIPIAGFEVWQTRHGQPQSAARRATARTIVSHHLGIEAGRVFRKRVLVK